MWTFFGRHVFNNYANQYSRKHRKVDVLGGHNATENIKTTDAVAVNIFILTVYTHCSTKQTRKLPFK